MVAFPAITELGGAGVTTAQFQSRIEAFLAASKQLVGGNASSNLTISGGNVTPTVSFHRIDTQGAAATDDLDHALVTNLPAGSVLILKSVNSARVVVVRNAQGGSGQFLTSDSANFSLASTTMAIAFIRESSDTWVELFRDYGNQVSVNRTYLGLGTVATLNQGATGAGVPQSQDILGKRNMDLQIKSFSAPTGAAGATSSGIYTPNFSADGLQMTEFAGGVKLCGWIFSDTTGQEIYTQFVMDRRWDKGSVGVEILWLGNSAAANGVRWGVAAQSIGAGESFPSATYSSESGVTQANSGLNTLNRTGEVAVTVGGTPADGEFTTLRIRRVPGDAGDTLATTASIIGVRLNYTINALRSN